MEIYKDISNTQNEKFKKLLIDNFSKTKIVEGKLLTGTISKISEKHFYIMIPGMKSEAIIDAVQNMEKMSARDFAAILGNLDN